MKKLYYKELPLFHIYDSNLTGSQKLLKTLHQIDDTYDIYTLGSLAKLRAEDEIFDLQELKKRGYFQDRRKQERIFLQGEMISRNRVSLNRAPALPKSVHLHGFVKCTTVP